jgi:hypothetical protein
VDHLLVGQGRQRRLAILAVVGAVGTIANGRAIKQSTKGFDAAEETQER